MNDEINTYTPEATFSRKFILPGKGVQHPYPAMDSTSNYLNQCGITEYNLVEVGEYGFSDKPMASFGYKFCDVLVIRDPKRKSFRALGHIISGFDPNEYVDRMVELFPDRKELEAIIIKAGEARVRLIEACLRNGIHIIPTDDIPMKDEHHTYAHDVIVRPNQGKVIINLESLGLREIDF